MKNMLDREVRINGDRLCTAGISPDAALNATVNVIGQVDQITIRVIETEAIDSPVLRNPNAPSK